jgi:hypothetical protein
VLFAGADRDRVADGSLTVAFRAWAAPRVVAGRTYRTNAGRVVVEEVSVVDPANLTEDDAYAAGRPDLPTLLGELERHRRGPLVFRVAFHLAEDADPRAALAQDAVLNAEAIAAIRARLDRSDAFSRSGPWTRATLRMIAHHPGVVSTSLAAELGRDRAPFKLDVRKLKALGLTESLDVGYRLSLRGRAFLDADTAG